MGICLDRDEDCVTTGVSSFVKSYVNLRVVFGVGNEIGPGGCDEDDRSFKTEWITVGAMMIGTCLGLRLLKPASWAVADEGEVCAMEANCSD